LGGWLAATPLSRAAHAALNSSTWLAPTDETLHILALTGLFVSAAVVHLRVLGGSPRIGRSDPWRAGSCP
jgi:hypothetical protein